MNVDWHHRDIPNTGRITLEVNGDEKFFIKKGLQLYLETLSRDKYNAPDIKLIEEMLSQLEPPVN